MKTTHVKISKKPEKFRENREIFTVGCFKKMGSKKISKWPLF